MTGLSPSRAPVSRGIEPGPSLRTLLQTTIRMAWPPDSQVGLFPVRSPLLRESLVGGDAMRDAQADVPSAKWLHVQLALRLDGSRDSAIHTKYRISLCSSSMRELRYPFPRVVMTFVRHPVAPTRSANGVRGGRVLR
ncbi:hypothetical protein SASPL_150365 [Salvia splendens]|uniref:Uncharacterized protein n=1 Tax=Salvia splendens TaxID=180675 RepID=A0A8X8W778_SALSN|nr:hypothetical protein SASPL_150365 [Salvia splendens]